MSQSSPVPSEPTAVVQRGFILLRDTICQGIIVSCWETGPDHVTAPSFYATRADADSSMADSVAARADAGMDEEGEDDREWASAVEILADGTYVVPEEALRWTAAELEAMR